MEASEVNHEQEDHKNDDHDCEVSRLIQEHEVGDAELLLSLLFHDIKDND